MVDNKDFSHLPLPFLSNGKPKLHGYGSVSLRTNQNKKNRKKHGESLIKSSSNLSNFWKEKRKKYLKEGLQIKSGIPILLSIDPCCDIEFLRGLGFEIVCEQEEGFIIVASKDVELSFFNQKINDFINNSYNKCNSPAKVYALCEEKDRIEQILDKDLYAKWSKILPNSLYTIDIGISCCGDIKMPDRPQKDKNETDKSYAKRLKKWEEKNKIELGKWEKIRIEREDNLEKFISEYQGVILEMWDGSSEEHPICDSFSARLRINGKCLQDLVLNFPYLFEIKEPAEINMGLFDGKDHTEEWDIELEAPSESDPTICVIDSGIQEQHKYLSDAILQKESISMLPNNESVADEVESGGHGTRVAGAILYPNKIPKSGKYKLPSKIINFRVLDKDNKMPEEIFPAKVISSAIENFYKDKSHPTRIYNHSIGTCEPCEMKHMSYWAFEIDSQSYNNDVLYIQAGGNVQTYRIREYLKKGYQYPDYLLDEPCRISDPAQSLQAITVGSVSNSDFETKDLIALGKFNEVSSFSRTGPGIWDVIKPDVVEYGGTHAYNKGTNPPILSTPEGVCPELIRKSPQGPAFAKDAIGTSFATPKVTYIVSQIEKILPQSPTLLYRALIAQSARWPTKIKDISKGTCSLMLRHLGYGIPDEDRATKNTEYRITLITPKLMKLGSNEAHVYKISIPEQLSSVGEDFEILVEITLSYVAKPRRTRRNIKGYLSTWLDWCCSRIGEKEENFTKRIFETGSKVDDEGNFKWVLGDATNRGLASGYSRKNGTLQKDWCVIKSNQLSDAFCIAVRGHKGWSDFFKAKYTLVVSFEAINKDIKIYDLIRSEISATIENSEIRVNI